MLLYELPSRFFVELTYNTTDKDVRCHELLANEARLEDYALFVRLPSWVPPAD